MKDQRLREMRIEVHRDAKGKITGHTVHHHMESTKKNTGPYYDGGKSTSFPFGKDQHEDMVDHVSEHLEVED